MTETSRDGPGGAGYWAAEAALTRLASRDLRRAAAFLWITPLLAALSMRFMAALVASAVLSAPDSAADRADLVRRYGVEPIASRPLGKAWSNRGEATV